MVNQQNFLLPEIPKLHPKSKDYKDFWKEQLHYCHNGISIAGKYMPGRLYSYVNFGTIELINEKTGRKKKGRPLLRDNEWEFFEAFETARKSQKGILDIEGRRGGKSFRGSWLAAYEYTFFRDNEIVVSAHESKYSDPLMQKVRIHLDGLSGTPFYHHRFKDDITSELRSGYRIKTARGWERKGYDSRIFNIKFKDDHTAANGKSSSVFIFEEIGMFDNLDAAYNSAEPCWKEGSFWFGTPLLFGTGGDMDRGSIAARKMFYEPDTYNLLKFNSDYGEDICFFQPGWKCLNDFKRVFSKAEGGDGETLMTMETEAKAQINKERDEKKAGKSKDAYYQHLQYYPDNPEHAFLSVSGNIFPTALLEEQLSRVFRDRNLKHKGRHGVMKISAEGKAEFHEKDTAEEAPYPFDEARKEGCVTIYEEPELINGQIPFNLYLAATDPYRQDDSENSTSLGSTFIWKQFYGMGRTYNILVAEYTGRPEGKSDDYNEQARLLCLYYNSRNLFENEVTGFKTWFERKHSDYLLVDQPTDIIRSISPNSTVNRTKGCHKTAPITNQAEIWLRDLLIEERGEGDLNLHHIYSPYLLRELISYSQKGNFDRVDAMLMLVIHIRSVMPIGVSDVEKEKEPNPAQELDQIFGFDNSPQHEEIPQLPDFNEVVSSPDFGF